MQDDTTSTVWIGQPAYTEALLKKFEMDQAKVSATPVDSSNKLVKASEGDNAFDQHMYQSAVGSLYCTFLLLRDPTLRMQSVM